MERKRSMIIKADKEGIQALTELVDVVLKLAGLKAYNSVGIILNSVKPLEETEVSKTEVPKLEIAK
jgi:hypothetical protein